MIREMATDELWGRPIRRILAIAREHIGDLVNTTPYLRALQDRFPEAQITVDVGRSAAPVLVGFPGLAAVWARDKHEGLGGKLRFVRRIRRERFDLAVIFDDSSRFVLECFLARVPIRVGVFRKRFSGLFTRKVDYSRERHDVFDPFNDLMATLGAPISDPRPRLYPSEADVAKAEAAFKDREEKGRGLIGLNPATVRPYNRWPAANWAALADLLAEAGSVPVLLGPPSEADAHREIASMATAPVLDWTGRFSILELYEVCRRLPGLASVDTGTAHLAGAVGTPVAVLYGVTEPHRFRPFGDRFVAVRAAEKTMEAIRPEDVFEALGTLLGPTPW